VEYALEGSNFIAGAAVQWLRDMLKIVEKASDTEALSMSVPDTGGVYLVPAFVGLGAPYWDMYARGALVGITRGTKREHLARAALEAIAYQVKDVLDIMAAEAGIKLSELRVDGGASANNFLMQFQSDIIEADVLRPTVLETTALGAAYLAGLGVGYWKSKEEVASRWEMDRRFRPAMDAAKRDALYQGWKRAVERSLKWAEE
jgi:glycerol kinase